MHLCYNLQYPEMLRVMHFFQIYFVCVSICRAILYSFLFCGETVKSNLIIFRVDRNTVGLVKKYVVPKFYLLPYSFFSSTSDITNFCFVQIACCCFCLVNNETFMNLKILYLNYDTSVFRT